jgi:CRISPR-associated protein Cmr2
MLDGDDMGKWLSGEKAPSFQGIYHPDVWKNMSEDFRRRLHGKKRQMAPALHSTISIALRDYSLRFVKKIVEEKNSGKLVYSGGDDVLAFVNLDSLLDVMVKLRAAFSGHIDKNLKVDFTKEISGFVDFGDEVILTMGPDATASIGACIAHYKTPLIVVLNTARRMEKKAKEIDGKDAFAISLLKHSGEVTEASFKWRYVDNADAKEGTISTLKRLVSELKKGKKKENQGFSDAFIYNLNEEFKRLVVEDRLTICDGIIKTEIKRLLSRSCQMKGETDKKKIIEKLADALFQTYVDSNSFKKFISFLNIAVFLTRESTI